MTGLARHDHRRRNGALLLIAAAILVALAWLKPNPFANPYEVQALFADAGGLGKTGAEVRIAGTTAGKVTGYERRGELAVVTMALDVPEDTVRTDATAALRPRLLFEGTSYVDLEPGSPAAEALGDSALPVAQTRTAVSVADALAMLDAPTRGALQTTAKELRTSAAPRALNSALGDLPAVTRDAGVVGRAARGSDGDALRRAVAGFGRTSRAVATARADLVPAGDGLARTAHAATSAPPALDAALAGLPATVTDTRTGAQAASAVLDGLAPLASELEPGVERLAPTLAAVRPVARAATPVLRATGPLVDDARGTLADAARGAPGARAVLRQAEPVLTTFEGGLLDALERPTALGTPAYLSFLGLFAGGGGASRPFVPDEGHFMRFGFRFLTGFGQPVPPCTLLADVSAPLAATLEEAGGCQQ